MNPVLGSWMRCQRARLRVLGQRLHPDDASLGL